ncbi:unnamed protein product [Knipowitschia caucasica]
MPGRGRPRTAKSLNEKPTCKTQAETSSLDASSARKPLAKTSKEKEKTSEKLPVDYISEDREDTPVNTGKKPVQASSQDPPPGSSTHVKGTARGARPKASSVQAKLHVDNEDCSNSKTLNTDVKERNKDPKATTKKKSPKAQSQKEDASVFVDESSKVTTELKKPSLKDNKANTLLKAELRKTLDKLKIRMNEKSKASEVINKIEKVILEHLRTTLFFGQVIEPLHTGSYYENLKISNPDEFDIMFPIPIKRINIQPFKEDGAFYIASLKRDTHSRLQEFQQGVDKPLPASKILQKFRDEVICSVQNFTGAKVNIYRKKKGCPAVTLSVEIESQLISLDIVLCLAITSSWPDFTNDGMKIETWLGGKVKRNYKYKPYYLVPKYEGSGTVESNGISAKDSWRISVSHVEKEILTNHGSEKTCCEKDGARCCRKDCVKLLKHLLSLLKEQDKSFDKFCSYHVKTTFLHACCSRPKDSQWAAADLALCFEQLLEDFENHLKRRQLSNFFIPTQNLLDGCSQKNCNLLALCINKEKKEGFPIFKG